MSDLLLAGSSAVWFGILTSISPCPLATNLAAVSYVSRRIQNPYAVFLTGLAYTTGRTLAYLGLAVLVLASLLSIPHVASFLEMYMNQALGPALILVGLLLLGVLRLPARGSGLPQRVGERVEKWGVVGALVLGFTFALTFCPVSAALFFGSLIPLAVKSQSQVLIPSMYGVGTAIPVLGFALLLSLGFQAVGKLFEQLRLFELWARRLTALVIAGVGVYLTLTYVFQIFD